MTTLADMDAGLREALPVKAGSVLPQNAPTPFALVTPPNPIRYRGTFGNDGLWGEQTGTLAWTVTLFLGTTIAADSATKAFEYMEFSGDKSIRQALEADPTLGGRAHDCVVDSVRTLSPEEIGIYERFGIEFTVFVVARRADAS